MHYLISIIFFAVPYFLIYIDFGNMSVLKTSVICRLNTLYVNLSGSLEQYNTHETDKQAIQATLDSPILIIVGTETEHTSEVAFDYALLETLDDVFSSLGEVCKQEIYRQLDKKYGLSRQTIPKNIQTFTNAIEEIFGEGSFFLEIKIMLLLHNKVQDFKYYIGNEELSFSNYLENLQYHLFV